MKDRNTDGQLHTQQHNKAAKLAVVRWFVSTINQPHFSFYTYTALHWDKQKML